MPSGKMSTTSPAPRASWQARNMSELSWPPLGPPPEAPRPLWTGIAPIHSITCLATGYLQIASSARIRGRRGSTDISTIASAAPPKWLDTNSTGPEAVAETSPDSTSRQVTVAIAATRRACSTWRLQRPGPLGTSGGPPAADCAGRGSPIAHLPGAPRLTCAARAVIVGDSGVPVRALVRFMATRR